MFRTSSMRYQFCVRRTSEFDRTGCQVQAVFNPQLGGGGGSVETGGVWERSSLAFRQGDPYNFSVCARARTLLRNMRISRRQKDDNMNHIVGVWGVAR